ncbi:MAG: helix-turn-helix transcriptional regulator [Hyphomicrobiales bacterium]
MLQAEIPVQLLSLLYATQTDRTMWQSFCDELNFICEVPIMMFGHNISKNESLGLLGGGLDPEELKSYHQNFADKNPWMHMNTTMPTGAVGISDQAMTRRELFRTEFYNDWLRKQEDIVAGPFMMCHRTQSTFVGLAAACLQSNVENTLPRAHALLEALAPHLKRVISFASLTKTQACHSLGFIEASKHAIFLLTRSGKVSLSNQAGDRLLSSFSFLGLTKSNRFTSQSESISFFINRLNSAIEAGNPLMLPDPVFAFDGERHSFAMHAHMFPNMSQSEFPTSSWSDPVVGAIIVTGGQANDDFCKIAASFGATVAEQKLADAVAQGQRLNDYADVRGLSRHTVRNQMRALLTKSNCENQTDFARLLLSLSSPFEGG